ncbi:LOW QUALITY PROTEIN: cilia- and flagella-associated protein 206 [Drosophila grimshawi]|uniref:LOW QUALITY PROTEIN: cilia- and flagella-associated protein 206 n=1 Tax=Drosophila grimshawi TaxID=7222 RepID=UPI001C932B25|nr:LOW QUALITY PROTEIN: cilia- and flagella-associated protein 206 [Drosophila grimshawi]
MSHPQHKFLDEITQRILAQLKERDIDEDVKFMKFVVHLMVRDMRRGLLQTDLNKPSACNIAAFIDDIVSGYLDKTDTTMANMRMSWIVKMGHGIQLSYVREQYEQQFQQQLKLLIADILQYPESCSKLQLDQLFAKMQVFIVATNHLGCPRNHVLLKLTAMALNSVIGRSDLQNYVLKKKYHRQEYLQRLADTVAGIVIYNNDGPDGDRENVRYVIGDLEMAQSNTNAGFNAALERLKNLCDRCQTAVSDQLQFNCKETQLLYRVPLEQLHRINQFTVTFYMLQRCLTALKRSYEHTAYLVSVETGRYECVVAKINDTLSMRTSIQSELIFPHFVYLSKVWSNLNHYFNHIVELNKLREQLEQQVTKEMAHRAKDTITQIQDLAKRRKDWFECSFFERMDALKKYQTDGNFCSLAKADIKEFCGLTLAVTNGLLLPAKVQRKLCMNVDIKFGFQDETYARIGELWFERFITALRQAIFNSANLALLFKLDDALIEKELQPVPVEPPKQTTFNGQTEMVVTNDLSPSNWINVTWNAWDYHRETIHLAEIRKRQTHDAQTKVTYGQRNAQNQTYNTRQHL